MTLLAQVLKANPYHDPKSGRFTFSPRGPSQNSLNAAFDGYYEDPVLLSGKVQTMGLPLKTRRVKRRPGHFPTTLLDEDIPPIDPVHRPNLPLSNRRVYAAKSETLMAALSKVMKFNPYHDPKTGRFSSKGGGMSQGENKNWKSTSGYVGPKIPPFSKPTDTGQSIAHVYSSVPNYAEYDQKILAAEAAGDKKQAKKLRDDMDREEVESRGLVRANDLKKGTRVVLRNGFEADLYDNGKGNTRLAKVYGDYTEIGSVYTKDILEAKQGENWKKVALSAAQRKAAKKIRAAGW